MAKMKIEAPIIDDDTVLEVEFGIYTYPDLPNQFDIYGTTPEIDLTEEQETAILEYLSENFEPTVDADRD